MSTSIRDGGNNPVSLQTLTLLSGNVLPQSSPSDATGNPYSVANPLATWPGYVVNVSLLTNPSNGAQVGRQVSAIGDADSAGSGSVAEVFAHRLQTQNFILEALLMEMSRVRIALEHITGLDLSSLADNSGTLTQ